MEAVGLLRAALVGCGRIGAFTRPELRARLGPNWIPLSHAEALSSCSGMELVACCDVEPSAAERAARNFDISATYADPKAMIAEIRPDILSVATRSDVRPEILELAAESGVRGVHSEKPLATTLRDTKRTCRALRQAGVAFSYGAIRRYMPIFQRARDIAASGEIGALQAITARFGKGGLMWTHPHSIDLLCFLAGDGPIEHVQATLQLDPGQASDGIVDLDPPVLSAAILFANGVVANIVPEPGLSVDIVGQEAAISVVGDGAHLLHRDFNLGLECQPNRDWCFEADESEVSGRVRALENLRDSVVNGAPSAISLEQVLDQHRILFAFVQSHLEGGRRISLDDVDPTLTVTGRQGGLAA